MVLEKAAFRKYNEKRLDTFTTRLNKEERELLDKCKEILEQPKDSTAWKQMAIIGANVLHDPLVGGIMRTLFINKRRNKERGIINFD